jgi:hypothetical protein
MKRVAMLLAAVLVASVSTDVLADCKCSCVNGQIEAVCRLPSELPPVCAPKACTVKAPKPMLVNQTNVATNRSKECRETLKFNEATGAYIAQQVCR